jgi:hypothetical protein
MGCLFDEPFSRQHQVGQEIAETFERAGGDHIVKQCSIFYQSRYRKRLCLRQGDQFVLVINFVLSSSVLTTWFLFLLNFCKVDIRIVQYVVSAVKRLPTKVFLGKGVPPHAYRYPTENRSRSPLRVSRTLV